MSAPLLMFPLKPTHLFDDLESFLHVLEIFGMRFHLHSDSSKVIVMSEGGGLEVYDAAANTKFASILRHHYYSAHEQGGHFISGDEKYNRLSRGVPPVQFNSPFRPPGALPTLLSKWYKMFSQHYGTLEETEWRFPWGVLYGQVPVSQNVRDSVAKCTLFKMTHEGLDVPWRAVLDD